MMVVNGYDDVITTYNWTSRVSSSDRLLFEAALDLRLNTTTDPDGGHASVAARVGLGLVSLLPLVTIVGSVVTCLAVKWDSRLHHTSYYFALSLAVLHATMAVSVMPPAIVVTWQGEFRCSDALCKLWITADLFFCNNTCLHLAFMNMDTFLRLKDPLRHGRNVTACSLLLWLGAPWTVSLVQSIAQFMLSQADADSRSRPGLCFIADKNFVILGTLFSFAIPTTVAVSFAALCRREIDALRGRVFCSSTGLTPPGEEGALGSVDDDEDDESYNASDSTYGGGADESEENRSETMSAPGDAVDRASISTEQVQLEVVTAAASTSTIAAQESNHQRGGGRGRGIISLRDSSIDSEDNFRDTNNKPERLSTVDSSSCDGLNSGADHHRRNNSSSSSCNALLLRQSGFRDGAPGDDRSDHPRASTAPTDDFVNVPDQTLRQELSVSRLTLLTMAVHIALWVPLSASNVVFGVCQGCREVMTFALTVTFKWLAYGSAAVGVIVYAQFFDAVRQIYWNLVRCRCRSRHRGIP